MTPTAPDWVPVPGAVGRLYEGARWLPGPGVFQWVDILGATLHRWAPGQPVAEARALELEFATVAIPLDDDRSLVASRSSLHEYSWSRGTLTSLGEWTFDPDVRFNDGERSPGGEIYIGTMSMQRRPDAGALYRFADGVLEPVLTGIGISNGLGWRSPERAFYIDSLVPRIHTVDLTSSTPELTPLLGLDESEEPDGLAITPEGELLVADWGNGKLIRVSADGTRLADVGVPARFPTSVAVGGADLDLVLVTTAATDDPEGRGSMRGHVLVARRHGEGP